MYVVFDQFLQTQYVPGLSLILHKEFNYANGTLELNSVVNRIKLRQENEQGNKYINRKRKSRTGK